MKLHTGRLYWPEISKTKDLKSHKILKENHNDILVVGGGMSGSLSAYVLSKAGYKVTLVEKNKVASGSTSANTGLIQYMSDLGLVSFIDQIGEKEAVNFYDESVEAIENLQKIEKDLLDFETENFALEDSLIIATDRDKVENIKKEVEKQKEENYGASFLDKKDLNKINIKAYAALKASPDISLNPFVFVNRLVYTAIEKYGLHLMENTELIDFENLEDGVEVSLKNQESFKTKFKKVILATGYLVPEKIKKNLEKLEIYKTYVSVSEEKIDLGLKDKYLLWEVKEPYTYFKYTFENKLMIGGLDTKGDNLTEEDGSKNAEKLVDLAKEMLLDANFKITPKYSYGALFGESSDNLPYMGVLPENENIFVICGVGGNGTVYSTIASKIISKWIEKKDISKYKTFRLGR